MCVSVCVCVCVCVWGGGGIQLTFDWCISSSSEDIYIATTIKVYKNIEAMTILRAQMKSNRL